MKNRILLCLITFFSVVPVFAGVRTTPAFAPTITAGTATGIISACAGSPSVSPNIQHFTVSGNGLTTDMTATAPAGFEVSLAAGNGYGASVTLIQAGGTLNNTTVYVRSAASALGNITGNVALSSAGAISQNIAVTGTVHALPTINAVPNQTLLKGAPTTAINFTGTGINSWVNNTPGVGLAANGTGNIASFNAVNIGAAPVTATITVTPNSKTSLYAYIGNALDGTVSVINTNTQAVVATIPVGLSPFGVAASPDASRAYVSNFDGNSVSVINTATNTVTATVPVGTGPRGICISPNGNFVYVVNGSAATMSVISTATNTVTATVAITANPNGITVSPDGSKLYITNQFGNSVSVVNTATNTTITTFGANSTPFGIALSADGSKLYVTNANSAIVSVFNTANNALLATITVGTNPFAISASPDGNLVYVANQSSNNVSVINATTNTVVATIPVGTSPRGISVSPDGSQVYVTNLGSNNVSVISTTTNTVIKTVAVGSDPISYGNFITGGPGCTGAPVTFTIKVNPSPVGAAIIPGAATGNIYSCSGTPSANPNIEQFTVSGTKLTANITATAPAGFEVSLASGNGYGSSVTLTQVAGTVNNTVVYVRSSATASGHITGNVVLTSAGTTSQNVFVSGTANLLPSANIVPNQTVTNGAATTTVNFTGHASSFTWVNNTPGIGLAASGTGNIASFIAANAGAAPITATITVTPVPVPGLAYITNRNANTVSVINTTTNAVVATIPVGKSPQGISISPDGGKAYVTNGVDGTVSVINTATNAVVATIAAGSSPSAASVSPDGSKVYVSNSIPSGGVSVIDAATNTVTATIKVGAINSGITVSPDGSNVYLASSSNSNIVVIDAATNTITTTISGGVDPQGTAISSDGSILYTTNILANDVAVINTTTNAVITTIPVGTSPFGISISPNGSRLYVTNLGGANVSVINTANNTVVATVTVGTSPDGISVSPDGSKVYVANQGDNTVSVINTTTNTVTATVPVGTGPSSFGNFVIGGSGCGGTTSTFTITVNPTATPAITATGALTALTTVQGTPSASANFTVSGTNMTAGILVNPPPGFEVSSDNITFSNTVTVGAAGTIAATKVYVRLAAATAPGTYSGNIVLRSAGAANVNETTVASTVTTSALQNQTITFGPIPAKTYGNADFAPGATASSGLAVTYTSSNTAVATIVGGNIHIVSAGTSNITASQAGNASFNAATNVVQSLTVNKAAQTITFAALSPATYGAADFTPAAAATSGLVVTFTSSNLTVATIVNGQVHIVGTGTTVITAAQSGDGNFVAAANVTQSLTVGVATQTITFSALGVKNIGGPDFDPGATASSGLAVNYTSSNTSVATIVNSKIRIVGAGTSTITASQAGNTDYSAAASVQQVLTVNKDPQTITFTAIPSKIIGGPDFDPGAIASSGLAITYSSSNPVVATIVNGLIHITGVGTADITASQNGDNTFATATDVMQTLAVSDIAHIVTISHPVVTPNGDGINDILKIDGITDFPDNKVVLVNVNGVKIYEQSGYDNGSNAFDGHSNINGAFQQRGTYFYMVEYRDNGITKRLRGYFVLKY